jgi:hypothetical protein
MHGRQGAGSRIDARSPGVGTRFGPEDIETIPTRRASMFDWIRAAPGISPTSPSSGIATTISAFGSGTTLRKLGRMNLLLDVLNLLNDAAEESLATETQMTVISPTFGQPVSFVDPRRAMLGVRLHLGR